MSSWFEALSLSTLLVALAEMGDKTQLLAFVLAARLKRPLAIVAGIFVATIVNHALAGWIGLWLAQWLEPRTLRWIVAAAFIGFGLWTLVPDKLDEPKTVSQRSAFITTLVAFFLAEMGDKTQLATVALAARYVELAGGLTAVVAGTTIGMMLANAPAVWLGEKLAQRVPMKLVRWIAATLFVVVGLVTLWVS